MMEVFSVHSKQTSEKYCLKILNIYKSCSDVREVSLPPPFPHHKLISENQFTKSKWVLNFQINFLNGDGKG